jgi:hypothetical protein
MKLAKYKEMSRERNKKPKFMNALKHRMLTNNPMNNPGSRKKISDKLRGVPKSEEHKRKMYQPMKDPKIAAKRRGKNNPVYDHTIRTFEHKDGSIETCTQRELIEKYNLNKGNVATMINHPDKVKTVSGWRVKKHEQ